MKTKIKLFLIAVASLPLAGLNAQFSQLYRKAPKLSYPYLSDAATWGDWVYDSLSRQNSLLYKAELRATFFSDKNLRILKDRKFEGDTGNMLKQLAVEKLRHLQDTGSVWCDSTVTTYRLQPGEDCLDIRDHFSDFHLDRIYIQGAFPPSETGETRYVLACVIGYYEGAFYTSLLVGVNSKGEITRIYDLSWSAPNYGNANEMYRRARLKADKLESWERRWNDGTTGILFRSTDFDKGMTRSEWLYYTGLYVDTLGGEALFVSNDQNGYRVEYFNLATRKKQSLLVASRDEAGFSFRFPGEEISHQVSFIRDMLVWTKPNRNRLLLTRQSMYYFDSDTENPGSLFPDILYEDQE
ncbi:MAG: hypothetical protein JNL57_05580 [Bacteroidetes bacterium]|nr:hypothetical protein [Bacteroidota bacterium]